MKKLILFVAVFSLGTMFAQDNNEAGLDQLEGKLDGAYEKVTLKERETIAYDHLREADIVWEKRVWRVIDCKEKMNLPFIHPKMGFVKIVHDAAKNGELAVYRPGEEGETFKQTLNVNDVNSIGSSTDTITSVSPFTGMDTMLVRSETFDPATVKKIKLKEVWLFDKETSTMLVRILGVGFVRDRISRESGESLGDETMYWVYYPDLRKLISQYPVYNIKNDASTLSWEDMFEIRYFSSYIVKESNAYDRKISEYATGLDLLYESDRISNDIRDYESELWEF